MVSVIVPVYKAKRFLSQCLDSILSQTDPELELILVDDGSPDSSGAICDEYAARDTRVRVIHKENGGVSRARNAGLEAASGQWVVFVDSDDVLDRHYLEYLKKAQQLSGADLVYCGIHKFTDLPLNHINAFDSYTTEVYDGEYARNNAFSIWYLPNIFDKLIRRELIGDLRFPPAVRAEDLWFSYEVLMKAEKIARICHCDLYGYRMNPDGAMGTVSSRSACDDLSLRMDIYSRLFSGKYAVTSRKLAVQTQRMLLSFALDARAKKNKALMADLQAAVRHLVPQMLLKEFHSPKERFECHLLRLSVPMWTFWHLVKHKLFGVPLYY